MKKAEIRQREILEHLQKEGAYPYSQIMDRYGISLRTMKADIAALNAQGFKIIGESSSKSYVLDRDSQEQQDFYDASDRKKIRKLVISLIVSSSKDGVEKNHQGTRYIRDRIGSPNDPMNLLQEDFEEKDINKSIESTISEMINDGELLLTDGRLRPGMNAQVQLPLSRRDAVRLLSLINLWAGGSAQEETLRQIADKLSLALNGQHLENNSKLDNILYSGNKSVNANEEAMTMLARQSYTTNMVKITYMSRKKEEIILDVACGLIVYSSDKKRSYLLGETVSGRIIINLSSIINVEKLDEINVVYRSKSYLDIAEAMFEISVEDPVHVVVSFDNIPSIKSKINNLQSNRINALVYMLDDKIIYEDDISGLNDFAHYLRRFGYGARVLEPQSLRDMMLESSRNLLEIYESEG